MSMLIQSINQISSEWRTLIWRAAWQGGFSLLLIWLCLRILPKLSGRVTAWLWRLAILKLIIAGIWVLPVELPWLSEIEANTTAIASPFVARSPAGENFVQSVANPKSGLHPSAPLLKGSSWLMVLWLVGVTGMLIRLIKHWTAARLKINSLSCPTDHEIQRLLRESCELMQIGRCPDLRVSEITESPFLVGLRTPVIVVPSVLLQSSQADLLKTALMHELAHLKRGDLCWNLLFATVEVLFYFHPLVWLARREWVLSQEIAADELALSASKISAASYAKSLLDLIVSCPDVSSCPHLVVSVSAAYSQLSRRMIAMQLLQGFTMKRKILTGILGLVLAAVTAVSWSLTARHVAGQDETSSKTPPSPPPVELKELPIDPKDLEAVKAFEQDYEPASGQAVRRIEPPFPASRLAYYRIHHNIQSQHMPSGPGTMTVVWTKDQHATKAMWFGEPQTGETLRRLVPSLFQISPQYLRGDDQWLSRQIPGDFSVRAEASREQIAAGLAEILSEALGTPITLKFEERETEVYVARGEFQLSALAKQRGFVLLDRAQIGTITSIEDGNPALCPRAYFPDFLDYVGHCCLTPIVSEVKQTPEGRIWFHSMLPPKAELDKLQWVNGAFPIPPEPMFKGLTEQTGLSFTKEQRKLPTVTVQASN